MKIFWRLAAFMALWLAAASWADQARIEATLDRFHQAAALADSEAYLDLLTPDAVFLGTDGSERWQGEAFRDFVLARFDKGDGWTYTPVSRRIAVSPEGDSAWFDETLQNESLGQCRGSGVLVRTGSGWKIAQYNLSVPIPNRVLPQVVAQIAASSEASGPSGVPTIPAGATSIAGSGTGSAATQAQSTGQPTSAEPVSTGESDSEVTPSSRCARKRFKTNRKGGCD